MQLVLCRSRCSPYVERVQVALRLKRATWEERYVSLVEKPDWFFDLAPLAKVPVLIVDGRPIAESLVILELLDELLPEPRLFPVDPIARAHVRVASRYLDDEVFPALYAFLREVVEYEVRPNGKRRFRFENGRVLLKPAEAIDERAALQARARFTAAAEHLDALAGALEGPIERFLGFTVVVQPLVHNPDFLFLDDPALPAWGRVDRGRWPRLARFLAEAETLPADHIEWMYG